MTQALRVLLIDDNRSDRALVLRELRQEFTQLEAIEIIDTDAFERALANGEFHIVVTDYQLHWNNGLAILQAVKAHYPQCPVIMFTNTGSEEIAVKALKSGLDDYVLKAPNRYIRLPASIRLALERQSQQQQTALLEIRLQRLLTQLKVGVFRASSEHKLLESNPAFLDILGVASLEQANALALLDLHECYRFHESPSSLQPLEREVQINRPDGVQLWGLLTTTPNTVAGQLVLDGLLENITERKEAELALQGLNTTLEERVQERTAELEQLAAKLKIANRDLEEFAATASHDLRAPLRNIEGFASLLQEDEPLSSQGTEYVQHIVESARRADILIQELLNYSRLGKGQITKEPTPVSAVVANVLTQSSILIQEQNAQIEVEEPLPIVTANLLILEQVLTNLLTNAIKFVPPGVTPKVRIWAESQGTTVRIWVEDNGIGIDQEQQQNIFKPFTRLHSNEKYRGTGIGLAIVRKGVEILEGEIGVESLSGMGSRFWLELPSETEKA